MGSCDRCFIQILLCGSAGRGDARQLFTPKARGDQCRHAIDQLPGCGRAGDASPGPARHMRPCCSVPWFLFVRLRDHCATLNERGEGATLPCDEPKQCMVHVSCAPAVHRSADPDRCPHPLYVLGIARSPAGSEVSESAECAGITQLVRRSCFCSKVAVAPGSNGPALEEQQYACLDKEVG